MARIVATLAFVLVLFSFGYSKDWIRVRVQVDGREAVQRVADSSLILFDCRISPPHTDLAVGPDQWGELLSLGLSYQVVEILPDPHGWEQHAQVRNPDYRFNYLTQDQLMNLYETWRAESPQYVSRQQIAVSHNGEPVYAYRLGRQGTGPDHPGRVQRFVFVGGMHAREWISHATVAHIFRKYLDLLQNPAAAPPILLDRVEVIVIPNLNPDGYRHSWNVQRMWRKNRRNNGSSFGVDLNRNFSMGWGGQGSSGSPTSDTYRGPSAFSEPETAGLRKFTQTLGNVAGFIDFHSYGQLILFPWGYVNQFCQHHNEHSTLGNQMRNAILQTPGVSYTVQRAAQLYVAGGCSEDWAYSEFNTKAYTFELRNLNTFLLPESQIAPTQNETWEAVRVFIASNLFLKKY
ncbi:MAG: M14 family zinc carboxypeptidase [Fimbriimonadaceae bacterium]